MGWGLNYSVEELQKALAGSWAPPLLTTGKMLLGGPSFHGAKQCPPWAAEADSVLGSLMALS